jgi:TM2 domain-containing membrane protein YozV
MKDETINFFLMSNAKLFPTDKIIFVKQRLEKLDNSKLALVSSLDYRNPTTLLIISIFLGTLGIDRFMMKETGMGILKLLTGGLCGILTIIDWFTITKRVKDYNFGLIQML